MQYKEIWFALEYESASFGKIIIVCETKYLNK